MSLLAFLFSRFLGFLLVLLSITPLWAATFIVDRFDDVDPTDTTIQPPITDCDDTVPNDCTLRGAIRKANTASGADTINLLTGTYVLNVAGSDEAASSGDLDITSNVTILGVGDADTIIYGQR